VLLIADMCPYSLENNIRSSFFLHFWRETVGNFKSSRGQLSPCQEKWIKRQLRVSSAGCKVMAPNTGFLLSSMPSYCRLQPIESSSAESVSVSDPEDKIWGSAVPTQSVTDRRGICGAPPPTEKRMTMMTVTSTAPASKLARSAVP